MKKPFVIAGLAATIGLAGLGAGVAHAATSSSDSNNPMSSLVDAIATKFNLDKTQVQQVFDEQKTKMDAEREQEVKDELAQLVTDGKLTQAQSDAITAKRAELEKEREANRDSFKDKTAEERKSEMDTKRTELEQWAKDNGIDTQYLKYVFGHGPGGRGGHGPGGHNAPDDNTSDSSDNSSSDS
jgi:predicted phage gp36 major capsid-like protein